MARRHSRKSHRRHSRKVHRKQQGGSQCAALPTLNAAFAQRGGSEQVVHQRGGMAPYEAGGNDLLMDKASMVQAQSYDQLGMIQEAGRLAASAQHGGRRRSRKARHSRKAHRKSRKAHRKSRRSHRRRQQRGGMAPLDMDSMLLPKSAYAFTGVNPQFYTEASVQPALKMGAGPQA
jgi:hypothetical protein